MNRLFSMIEVAGADAPAFLQGQLTQDVHRLAATPGLPAAWCNARGRVIVLVRFVRYEAERFGLIVPRSQVDALAKRLGLFRLRARVDIAPAGDDWHCAAVRESDDLAQLDALDLLPAAGPLEARQARGIVAFGLGGADRCVEVFGRREAFEAAGLDPRQPLDDAGWRRALIETGIPHLEGDACERFTAHMLNLDLLGALSFDKGCYTGQEIVARTQHLGQVKRRLLRFRLDSGEARPGGRLAVESVGNAGGGSVDDGGADAGEVVNAAGRELLAVVQLALAGRKLALDGNKAVPVELPYLATLVPPAAARHGEDGGY